MRAIESYVKVVYYLMCMFFERLELLQLFVSVARKRAKGASAEEGSLVG